MIIYPFMSAIMLMLAVTGKLRAQELSFTIKPDKTNYNKGEPVMCTLSLKNTGTKDIIVNNRFLVNIPDGPHDVSLVITGPNLLTALFISQINAGLPTDEFILLHPGNTTTKNYLISGDFLLSEAGSYSIVAYYENKTDPKASLKLPSAWKGTLISTKVWFNLH